MTNVNVEDLPRSDTSKQSRTSTQRRDLAGACLAHMLHDGFTDQIYALLPIWQSEFGLSYAGLAVIRALYSAAMGALQLPGTKLLGGVSSRAALSITTLVASAGYLVTALPGGFWVLCAGLTLAGIGSSTQHPRGSLLVTNAYGKDARGPLGIYNFAGDLGKATLPALVALLLPVLPWRTVVGLTAVLGAVVAFVLLLLIPRQHKIIEAPEQINIGKVQKGRNGGEGNQEKQEKQERQERQERQKCKDSEHHNGRGFGLLLTIGALDTAPRMGYLLFLPFLVHARGGTEATVGLSLALVFIGGALGKAVCGWLGHRLGVVLSVVTTEAATALIIIATIFLPLGPMLACLPLLGIVLNGTSSVLYGTVPELAPKGDMGRAFALFYTGVILSGGFAPILYGILADHTSRTVGISASAITAVIIIPFVLALRPALVQSKFEN